MKFTSKINKLISLFVLVCSVKSFTSDIEKNIREYFFSPDITILNISDWENPTVDDYLLIQDFMLKKKSDLMNTPLDNRPFKNNFLNDEFYKWIIMRMRFAFIENKIEKPSFHIEYFNNDPSKKNKCVICYASFPYETPKREPQQGINYIIKSLKKFKFDGHFVYRIGGWPNLKKGRLKYADVPYAFKPFLFEEARDLGYKTILWLDACCVPMKSLDPIFDLIQSQGLCYFSFGTLKWREFLNGHKYLMPFYNISENKNYEWGTTQIVGINVKNAEGNKLLDEWIKLAERKIPLLQGTDPPFTFLLNHLHLIERQIPPKYFVEMPWTLLDFARWKKKHPQAIVFHQYAFLRPNVVIPENIFN